MAVVAWICACLNWFCAGICLLWIIKSPKTASEFNIIWKSHLVPWLVALKNIFNQGYLSIWVNKESNECSKSKRAALMSLQEGALSSEKHSGPTQPFLPRFSKRQLHGRCVEKEYNEEMILKRWRQSEQNKQVRGGVEGYDITQRVWVWRRKRSLLNL